MKSGEVTLFTGESKALQITAQEKKIDISITDKEFFKDALDSVGSGSSINSKLAQIKNMAVDLKEEGLTITFSFKGDRLVTMGLEAKPRFSRLITRTDALEINNMRKLIELTM